MKKSIRLIFALCGLCVAGVQLGAEDLLLDGLIGVDTAEEDATFQVLAGMESEGKLLCLWNGDVLQAFLVTSQEPFAGDEAAYLKATTNGMKAQGAKKIKSEPLGTLTSASGLKFTSFLVQASFEEADSVQLMYLTRISDEMELIIVTLTSEEFLEDIKDRANKLMATAHRVGE